MELETKPTKTLSLIQVSRAIAILFVLIGHVNELFYRSFSYDLLNISEWGRTGGVDFFFVVSGFMIYYLYSKNRGDARKAKFFLVKRLVRIFPLYWLTLVLALCVVQFFPSLTSEDSLTIVAFVQNVTLMTEHPLLDVTWSLSFILFFYLLFACYLYRPTIMKHFISAWLLVIIISQFIDHRILFLLSYHHLEIALGCLAAYLILTVKIRFKTLYIYIGLVGFLLIWTNNVIGLIQQDILFLYGIFSVSLILGITSIDQESKRTVHPWFTTIGDASYSIYICHGPVIQLYLLLFSLTTLKWDFGNLYFMALIIILTTITCLFIYKFVELPLNNYLKKVIVGRGGSYTRWRLEVTKRSG